MWALSTSISHETVVSMGWPSPAAVPAKWNSQPCRPWPRPWLGVNTRDGGPASYISFSIPHMRPSFRGRLVVGMRGAGS